MHYSDHALSVVIPSVVVSFSHFRHLLWNRWTDSTKLDTKARYQCPLPSLCCSIGWHIFISPLKPLNRIQRNLTRSKISTPLSSLCWSGRSENQDGCPCPSIKKWHTVLRCSICGPLGLLFPYPCTQSHWRIKFYDIVLHFTVSPRYPGEKMQ